MCCAARLCARPAARSSVLPELRRYPQALLDAIAEMTPEERALADRAVAVAPGARRRAGHERPRGSRGRPAAGDRWLVCQGRKLTCTWSMWLAVGDPRSSMARQPEPPTIQINCFQITYSTLKRAAL